MFTAVFAGCDMPNGLERPRHVALVVEPDFLCDVGEEHVGCFKEFACGGEDFIGTHADDIKHVLDVAHFAVAPVERHDAAVEVLHVEAGVRKGVDERAERRRIRSGGLEEVLLHFLSFPQCHGVILSRNRCIIPQLYGSFSNELIVHYFVLFVQDFSSRI